MTKLGTSKEYLRGWRTAQDVGRDGAWGSCVHAGNLGLCGRMSLESGGQYAHDWGTRGK